MCSDKQEREEGAIPYVLAVFSAQELSKYAFMTYPVADFDED